MKPKVCAVQMIKLRVFTSAIPLIVFTVFTGFQRTKQVMRRWRASIEPSIVADATLRAELRSEPV